jgi:hypothetical protein
MDDLFPGQRPLGGGAAPFVGFVRTTKSPWPLARRPIVAWIGVDQNEVAFGADRCAGWKRRRPIDVLVSDLPTLQRLP